MYIERNTYNVYKEYKWTETGNQIYLYLECAYDDCGAKLDYRVVGQTKTLRGTHAIHSATDCQQTVAMETFNQMVDKIARTELEIKPTVIYKRAKDAVLEKFKGFLVPDTKKQEVQRRVKYLRKQAGELTRTNEVMLKTWCFTFSHTPQNFK